jgi:hypothetical protein
MRTQRTPGLLGVGLICIGAAGARADIVAFSFPAANALVDTNTGAGNDAFRFTPNVSVTVTSLGFFNGNAPGALAGPARSVAIFAASDTTSALAMASVDASSTVAGGFSWTPIGALTLVAGTSYYVVGTSPAGASEAHNDSGVIPGFAPAPEIAYGGYSYNYDPGLSAGNLVGYNGQYFGPNFRYVVPAPGSAALFAAGLVCAHRRRR